MDRYVAALHHTTVHSDAGPARLAIEQQRSRLWQELLCGVFRVHTALDRVPALRQRRLRPPERLTGRHAHLRMHQVHTCDGLRHRVLHLQARVHLEEVELRSIARPSNRNSMVPAFRYPAARAAATAASPIRPRSTGVSAGEGLSSITFW